MNNQELISETGRCEKRKRETKQKQTNQRNKGDFGRWERKRGKLEKLEIKRTNNQGSRKHENYVTEIIWGNLEIRSVISY